MGEEEHQTRETSSTQSDQEETSCGPECHCNEGSTESRGKLLVSIIILLAALAVFAYRFTHSEERKEGAGFAIAAQEETSMNQVNTPKPVKLDVLGEPIDSLASLNNIAADKTAVIVLLPSERSAQNEPVITAIAKTAKKITDKGFKVGTFQLARKTRDYQRLTARVSPPSVVTLVRNRSMAYTTGEINEQKLMNAYVQASRPRCNCKSGCATKAPKKTPEAKK